MLIFYNNASCKRHIDIERINTHYGEHNTNVFLLFYSIHIVLGLAIKYVIIVVASSSVFLQHYPQKRKHSLMRIKRKLQEMEISKDL